MHVYEVRPRRDRGGFDLLSDDCRSARYHDTEAAIGYANFYGRSQPNEVRVFDGAGALVAAESWAGGLPSAVSRSAPGRQLPNSMNGIAVEHAVRELEFRKFLVNRIVKDRWQVVQTLFHHQYLSYEFAKTDADINAVCELRLCLRVRAAGISLCDQCTQNLRVWHPRYVGVYRAQQLVMATCPPSFEARPANA